MWRDFRDRRNRCAGKAMLQHGGAWLSCVLLLILFTNAKLSRYEVHQQTLKLASTQSYLDGEEARKELSKITPLLCYVGIITVPLFIPTEAILLLAVIPSSPLFKGFDPESRLRPPPCR